MHRKLARRIAGLLQVGSSVTPITPVASARGHADLEALVFRAEEVDMPEQEHKCEKCGGTFSTAEDLQKHNKEQHGM